MEGNLFLRRFRCAVDSREKYFDISIYDAEGLSGTISVFGEGYATIARGTLEIKVHNGRLSVDVNKGTEREGFCYIHVGTEPVAGNYYLKRQRDKTLCMFRTSDDRAVRFEIEVDVCD